MDLKRGEVGAVPIGNDIVAKLDNILTGPNDRAFVVCSLADCNLNKKGQCTIFTLHDVPRMKTGQPCDSYTGNKV